MRRLVTSQRKLSAKKVRDARRNGRSIAFIQLDLEFSPCTGAAQSRVAKQTLARHLAVLRVPVKGTLCEIPAHCLHCPALSRAGAGSSHHESDRLLQGGHCGSVLKPA